MCENNEVREIFVLIETTQNKVIDHRSTIIVDNSTSDDRQVFRKVFLLQDSEMKERCKSQIDVCAFHIVPFILINLRFFDFTQISIQILRLIQFLFYLSHDTTSYDLPG